MAGGVVNRCHCQLIPDFGLQEAGLGLRELSLCFEHKENGFRAQFILTLLGRKILLREIQRLLTGGKTELRLFQLVHCVCHLQCDLLTQQPFVIQVAAARNQPCPEIRLSAAVPNWQIEGQRKSIGRKSETKKLIQRVAQSARCHLRSEEHTSELQSLTNLVCRL